MRINPFSTSPESPSVGRNTDGAAAVKRPGTVAPEPPLRAVPTHFGGEAILALVGEIDTSNTNIVREAVDQCLARRPDVLLLDVSGLTYCGATGVRGLRWALRRTEADNVEFHLVAPPPWLRRVLTAVRAHDLLAASSDSA
ncbi:STAS domain-containing protein [Pseudonocardia sp. Cha107L01]|jgi:anti-anti-sigma factor|uniref:STAS domain-containing protein n=1 Tax=Pseudonocardia sp. Cha107L01 TaxID=3457576 RepID=UPI00403E6F72